MGDKVKSDATRPPRLPARSSPLGRWFLRLGGTDPELIEDCGRFERVYFESQGAAIFITASLAAVSCAFALSVALGHEGDLRRYAIPAVLWGLVILNVDRWLVSGSDVGFSTTGSVVRDAMRWPFHAIKETIRVAPRFALAIVLGLLFAQPLILKLFTKEIDDALRQNQRLEISGVVAGLHRHGTAMVTKASTEQKAYDTAVQDTKDAYKKQIDPLASLALASAGGQDASQRQGCGQICMSITAQEAPILSRENADLVALAATYKDRLSEAHTLSVDGAREESISAADLRCSELRDAYLATGRHATTTNKGPCTPVVTVEAGFLAKMDAFDQVVNSQFRCATTADGSVPSELGPSAGSTSTTRPSTTRPSSANTNAIPGQQAVGPGTVVVTGTLEQCAGRSGIVIGRASSNAARAAGILRLTLVGIDTLPVLMKWLLALFPKTEYYKRVESIQAESAAESGRRRAAARQRAADALKSEHERSEIEGQLRADRREHYMRKVNEARIRLGLRKIDADTENAARRAEADSPTDPEDEDHPSASSGERHSRPPGEDGSPWLDDGDARKSADRVSDLSFLDES
jgi:hypothetical protein